MSRAVSGLEEDVAGIVSKELAPYVDEVYYDNLGNLIMKKDGTGPGPRILIAAHMDEIGGMVKYIDDEGFIYFIEVGSHDPAMLLGSRVAFERNVLGIVSRKTKGNELKIGDLYIDIGAKGKDEVEMLGIRQGSVFSRAPSYQRLAGTRRVSKSFDNRAGVCVMAEVLKRLDNFNGHLMAVATCQEEVGTRGSKVLSNYAEADIAIVLDVTFAVDTPQRVSPKDINTFLGKGPAITLKDDHFMMSPKMRRFVEGVAKGRGLPLQYDISPGGTDAGPIYLSKNGIPTVAMLVPLRYMHTGNEIIDLDDLENCVRLLIGIIENAEKQGSSGP